jgi:hypothetical protein
MRQFPFLKNSFSLVVLLFILFIACNNNETKSTTSQEDSTITIQDEIRADKDSVITVPDSNQSPSTKPPGNTPSKTYSNQRFKDIIVEKTGEHTFLIKGRAQIFEASFSWVIEDGHEELQQGHEMTDAGAPEWGNLSFTVNAPKKRASSTLHLVLFEISAKDGSRQHELPIPLY